MILEFQEGKLLSAQDELRTGKWPVPTCKSGDTRQLRLMLAFLFVVSFSSLPSPVLGESTVTLQWDANTESNLAGYNLKYGRSSGRYSSVVNVGKSTVTTVSNLVDGWYFFAVTAYDTMGLESDPSDEVPYLPPSTPPTISPIANQTVIMNSATPAIPFQIGDQETPVGNLVISASSSNPELVPVSRILLGGSGTNRTVQSIPATNQAGAAVITLSLADAGGNTASRSFILSVQPPPLNRAPTITAAASSFVVDEETPFAVTMTATDPDDSSANQLNWLLGEGAPAGLSINPTSGLLTWTPTEAQGPGTHFATVIVRDNGSPSLSNSRTLTWIVNEVNRPPAVNPISVLTAAVLARTTATITATDSDLPANTLRFSLASGSPVGTRIDPVLGIFTWTPTRSQAVSTNQITVQVADGGSPPKSAEKTFTVIVEDYAEITVGTNIIMAGQTGSVPIIVHSTVPLTSLSFSLDIMVSGLDEFALQPQVSLTSGSVTQSSPTRVDVNLQSSNASSLYTSKTVAFLTFRALAIQPSGFIWLMVRDMSASRSGSIPVGRILANHGRVVYINSQPLLETHMLGIQRRMTLYANLGVTCIIQHSSILAQPVTWGDAWYGRVTTPATLLSIGDPGVPSFYRALTLPSSLPKQSFAGSPDLFIIPAAASGMSRTIFDW